MKPLATFIRLFPSLSLLALTVLTGCSPGEKPATLKRSISAICESNGVLYVVAMNMRGMSQWRSEIWTVDMATASARKVATPGQVTRSIRVDDAGNILAAVPVRPNRSSLDRSPFDVWLYAKAEGYRGRRLGEGAIVGLPEPGVVLAYRTTFDANAAVSAPTPSQTDGSRAEAMSKAMDDWRQMDRATTTYLDLLPYAPVAAPAQLSHWTGMVGFVLQGRWLAVYGRERASLYGLYKSQSGEWELRESEATANTKGRLAYPEPMAISPASQLAATTWIQGEGRAQELALLVGKNPPIPLSGAQSRVLDMAWSHSGKAVALTVQSLAGTWAVIEVDPETRLTRILWSSADRPRHLIPAGPSSFAIVTGKTNDKQSVILLPEKKTLFEWQ